MIKSLLISTNDILISEIEEVVSEIGEPDCKLTNPYVVASTGELVPWLSDATEQKIFMISSDKIITLADPKNDLLKKYTKLFS